MGAEAKCMCQHCDTPITFPVEMAWQLVACPSCKLETRLFIAPQIPKLVQPPTTSTPASASPRDLRQFLFNILVILPCIILIILLLIANCYIGIHLSRPTWDYGEFTFKESDKQFYDEKDYKTKKMTRYQRMLVRGGFTADSAYTATGVLNSLGYDGWELVWSDGTRYIVRRIKGNWSYDYFSISYQADTNYTGPFNDQ